MAEKKWWPCPRKKTYAYSDREDSTDNKQLIVAYRPFENEAGMVQPGWYYSFFNEHAPWFGPVKTMRQAKELAFFLQYDFPEDDDA